MTRSKTARWTGLIAAILAVLPAVPLTASSASAQNAERRTYVLSGELRRDLDAHQFDAAQYEGAVTGIAEGLASGDLARVLDRATPTIRVTDGDRNTIVAKDRLGALGDKLLKSAGLRDDVMDDSQTIVRGDEIGLARGIFWISQACLDQACTQKKISLVTINLP
ncbi:hypothetical protein VQ02_06760 [Methylobacterium variabile]|uniref:Uncharacterized protein n=1 Tax=Methylobacterium variabile TaxID=298794 RepID=A0A0J6T0A5_9HYPH|nr:hypothetical protein [Methylobacterium variabile]KMO40875.1 hypothetical protein VQ02_06760 [Methylobacterium variabile]